MARALLVLACAACESDPFSESARRGSSEIFEREGCSKCRHWWVHRLVVKRSVWIFSRAVDLALNAVLHVEAVLILTAPRIVLWSSAEPTVLSRQRGNLCWSRVSSTKSLLIDVLGPIYDRRQRTSRG